MKKPKTYLRRWYYKEWFSGERFIDCPATCDKDAVEALIIARIGHDWPKESLRKGKLVKEKQR